MDRFNFATIVKIIKERMFSKNRSTEAVINHIKHLYYPNESDDLDSAKSSPILNGKQPVHSALSSYMADEVGTYEKMNFNWKSIVVTNLKKEHSFNLSDVSIKIYAIFRQQKYTLGAFTPLKDIANIEKFFIKEDYSEFLATVLWLTIYIIPNKHVDYDKRVKDFLEIQTLKEKIKEQDEEIDSYRKLLEYAPEEVLWKTVSEDILNQYRPYSLEDIRNKIKQKEKITLAGYVWRVLKYSKQYNRVLLLSEYSIETLSFHPSNISVPWRRCSLRNDHLNLNFYCSLPDILRESILEAELTNENKQYGMYLKESSKDKIFLLSIDEVMEYMPNFWDRVCLDVEGELVAWHLRSPGQYSNSAACVLKAGNIQEDGDAVLLSRGIRPAFWLDLTHIDKIAKMC